MCYRTGQVKNLEKALEICNRQSLDINDELLIEFLKYCLNTIPARNLEDVLIKIDFNGRIHNDKQFYNDLVLKVYEDVPGTNHNVLIAYYTALNVIYPGYDPGLSEENMTPIQHIKLLKRVHSTIPGKFVELLVTDTRIKLLLCFYRY